MRNIVLFFLAILPNLLMAEDIVQVVPFSAPIGLTENDYDEDHVMQLYMTNTNSYTGMQFDIYLPEGLSLQLNEEVWDFNSDRFDGITKRGIFTPYHDIDITEKDDVPGHYLVMLYDTDLSVIKGNDGGLIDFYYLTSTDMQPGIYPIVVTGTVLTIDSHNDVKPATSVSYVKIGTPAANTVYDLGGTTAEQLLVPSFVQTALNAENNVVVNETCRNLVLADGADYVAASAFTAANASYSAEVTSALGYKTVVLPYASAVPAGFEAYEVSSITGNTLNLASVSTITADKPVLLKNAGTASLSATDVAVSASTGSLTDGELIGTYAEIDAPVGSYVLQNQGGNVAFYNVQSTQPKVPAFRAYIKSQASGARFMNIVTDGQATGIMNVESGEMMDVKSIHTVDGVRRSALGNGINIVRTENGVKKVIINN